MLDSSRTGRSRTRPGAGRERRGADRGRDRRREVLCRLRRGGPPVQRHPLCGFALCQVAVTLTCAAPAGHALIGRALYLPETWATDEERRELAGVPEEVMFATKPQLAGELLQHAP